MDRPLLRRLRALLLALTATAAAILVSAPNALAYQPVEIVHTEQVQAGPYRLTVGFSAWPLRAMQSLDFTFIPDDGITGKSGTLTRVSPGGKLKTPLVRHPRKRDVWGLDVQALPAAGDWTFTFDIDGPAGHGTGSLQHLTVLDQPGPPMPLSWAVCALPVIGLTAFLVVAWRRNRPAREIAALGI